MYHHFLICCTTNFSKNCIVAVYLRSNQVAVWSLTMGDVMCIVQYASEIPTLRPSVRQCIL